MWYKLEQSCTDSATLSMVFWNPRYASERAEAETEKFLTWRRS